MQTFLLAALFVAAGGAGGLGGSIVGAVYGDGMLFVGGFVGGLIAAPLAAPIAVAMKWIRPDQMKGAAVGAALGFLAAATLAINTLSSPVGPTLSPLLVAAGALLG